MRLCTISMRVPNCPHASMPMLLLRIVVSAPSISALSYSIGMKHLIFTVLWYDLWYLLFVAAFPVGTHVLFHAHVLECRTLNRFLFDSCLYELYESIAYMPVSPPGVAANPLHCLSQKTTNLTTSWVVRAPDEALALSWVNHSNVRFMCMFVIVHFRPIR